MARSTYIYVLSWADRVGSAAPLAARTVKHEMTMFLIGMPTLDDMEVWRVKDGFTGDGPARTYLGTAREFLAKERP
jgi:hypothetical protein